MNKLLLLTLCLVSFGCASHSYTDKTNFKVTLIFIPNEIKIDSIKGIIKSERRTEIYNPRYTQIRKEIAGLQFLRDHFAEHAEEASEKIAILKEKLKATPEELIAYEVMFDAELEEKIFAEVEELGGGVIPSVPVPLY